MHLPPMQLELLQSIWPLHAWPSAHAGHDPPQSTSVSSPFATPSPQLGGAHFVLTQNPLAQSFPSEQPESFPHFAGHSPPQSTSDSPPFRILSSHVGAGRRSGGNVL